jgi:two-component system cell cycle response regulator
MPEDAEAQTIQPWKTMKVLLVEDDPAVPDAIQAMLLVGSARTEFTLVHADRLQAALQLLSEDGFDVVLLDLKLPDSRGTATVRRLRAEAPEVAIVVLTGTDDEEIVLQAVHAGAEDYLVKGHVESTALVRAIFSAAERRRMINRLLRMSLTDELTGLHNRRAFQALAEQQVKLAARHGLHLALFFADVNGFKLINDSFGHDEGDQALIETARMLQDCFRASDVIARWGGDEFAVLAVGCSAEGAEGLLGRLMEGMRRDNDSRDRAYQLSIAVGTATYDPAAPSSFEELLRRADEAMYQQKPR